MECRRYGRTDALFIDLENGDALPEITEANARVSVPSENCRADEFARRGLVMVDRTILVKVPVRKDKQEFDRYCRMPVSLTEGRSEEIRRVARKAFAQDHRFHISLAQNDAGLAEQILDCWIDEQNEVFQCRYKDALAGFADVRMIDGAPFVYLAAVDDRYRIAGTAASLYAAVFRFYQAQGVPFVYGRISSGNMAVMNLYASFGAQFSRPLDIYIKG